MPEIMFAKRRGEFFDLTDEYYESIDQDKHDEFIHEEEEREKEEE